MGNAASAIGQKKKQQPNCDSIIDDDDDQRQLQRQEQHRSETQQIHTAPAGEEPIAAEEEAIDNNSRTITAAAAAAPSQQRQSQQQSPQQSQVVAVAAVGVVVVDDPSSSLTPQQLLLPSHSQPESARNSSRRQPPSAALDKQSITTSRSYVNFGQSRLSAQQPAKSSGDLTASCSSSSSASVARLSKTYWPIACADRVFLPHFPIATAAQRQRFCWEPENGGAVTLLERGAFGVVYRVRNATTGADDCNNSGNSGGGSSELALKVLSKSQIIRNGALDQLKNEVDIQTVCGHHPFIVQCKAYWQTHRKICILTEFVSGGELFASASSNSSSSSIFPLALVRLYVLEIAIALDFLHNAGIVYRDLKPENVLLDGAGHVKLIDFGLSKWLRIGQRTRTFCGTLQYMAPELLAGRPYGHAVDWWALGVIACRMLTDQYPTLHKPPPIPDDVAAKMPATSNAPPYICELPSVCGTVDPAARDLLGRLLHIDPQQRLRSMYALERIAMYKGYAIADVRARKICPKALWK